MIGPRSGSADAAPAPTVNDNARPPTATASLITDSSVICGFLPTDCIELVLPTRTIPRIQALPACNVVSAGGAGGTGRSGLPHSSACGLPVAARAAGSARTAGPTGPAEPAGPTRRGGRLP